MAVCNFCRNPVTIVEARDTRLIPAWCPNCGAFSDGKGRMERPKAWELWNTIDQPKQRMLRETVRRILMAPLAFDTWTLQGFGMFRLYLSKSMRLHVWDDRFRTESVSTIHSHPWHFRSTVISGRMTDVLYEVSNFGFKTPTHSRQKIVCGPGGCAVGESESVLVEKLQEVTFVEGDSYSLTADAFHESKPESGTVTIIEREFREDTEHAYVCFPHGEKWVSAEPRKAIPKEIEAMAERALVRMNAGADYG